MYTCTIYLFYLIVFECVDGFLFYLFIFGGGFVFVFFRDIIKI